MKGGGGVGCVTCVALWLFVYNVARFFLCFPFFLFFISLYSLHSPGGIRYSGGMESLTDGWFWYYCSSSLTSAAIHVSMVIPHMLVYIFIYLFCFFFFGMLCKIISIIFFMPHSFFFSKKKCVLLIKFIWIFSFLIIDKLILDSKILNIKRKLFSTGWLSFSLEVAFVTN